MSLAPVPSTQSVKDQVSAAEWQARIDLAACYRLVAMHGWDDLIFTHISAKVPGTEDFLINPFGLMFHEITASSLVKVDQAGNMMFIYIGLRNGRHASGAKSLGKWAGKV